MIKRSFYFSVVVAMLSFTACDSAPKGDAANVEDAQDKVTSGDVSLAVDASSSSVLFTGYGVGKNHPGNLAIREGSLELKDNQVVGGSFVIDIKSMDMLETESYIDEKLLPHLLSSDFFDADNFPEATFEITGVSPFTPAQGETVVEGANFKVSGNLKLRNQVKNVTFPAAITVDDGVVKANANFDIDRTDWGMHYGNDKSLKDTFISPTVNIVLNISAKS